MKLVLCLLSFGLTAGGLAMAAGGALAPGDPAPPFSLEGSNGERYALEQFAGKRAVVIAWFPKAFTGG